MQHVIGIETSCDETAAAVVARRGPADGTIVSSIVRSQWEAHRAYGGVVPEIAARAHVEILDEVIALALDEAGMNIGQVDAVAATAGPGLIGGVLVGLCTAKAICLAADKPLIAVNHLEGHALTAGLTDGLAPPYLLLLVSGGHTQTLIIHDVGSYMRLGTTIDDALGEAFDKTAKLLGLGFPGGPAVESAAEGGDATRFRLPRPLLGTAEPHFSLAGLKTAVRRQAEGLAPLTDCDVRDLCASFQAAVAEVVDDRTCMAMRLYLDRLGRDAPRRLVIAGGVAANQTLRSSLQALADRMDFALHAPPVHLCGDNAAMIAWAGAERLARGWTDALNVEARARWPLDDSAAPAIGAGVKA